MALVPVQRTDDHHLAKQAEFSALSQRHRYRTVLLGDSLTRRWEDHQEQWIRYFTTDGHTVNLGVGQDTLENILWRVEHGNLAGMTPQVVVLLAGTNNLPTDPPDQIAEGIADLVGAIRTRLPETKVLLLALFPRNRDGSGVDFPSKIREVNAAICHLEDGDHIHYRNWGMLFDGGNDTVNPLVMPDGLHLNGPGYDLLGPILTKTLKDLGV